MITYSTDNLFADFDNGVTNAIVIPVNCVGVMGAGVALEAKKRWPKLASAWKEYNNIMKPIAGEIECCKAQPNIIFAMTKDNWKNPSKIEWVENICKELSNSNEILTGGIWSPRSEKLKIVGVPALGCGLGGLPWNDVKALYEKYLTESTIHFICYLPQ